MITDVRPPLFGEITQELISPSSHLPPRLNDYVPPSLYNTGGPETRHFTNAPSHYTYQTSITGKIPQKNDFKSFEGEVNSNQKHGQDVQYFAQYSQNQKLEKHEQGFYRKPPGDQRIYRKPAYTNPQKVQTVKIYIKDRPKMDPQNYTLESMEEEFKKMYNNDITSNYEKDNRYKEVFNNDEALFNPEKGSEKEQQIQTNAEKDNPMTSLQNKAEPVSDKPEDPTSNYQYRGERIQYPHSSPDKTQYTGAENTPLVPPLGK